jgi:hypothetical protein
MIFIVKTKILVCQCVSPNEYETFPGLPVSPFFMAYASPPAGGLPVAGLANRHAYPRHRVHRQGGASATATP